MPETYGESIQTVRTQARGLPGKSNTAGPLFAPAKVLWLAVLTMLVIGNYHHVLVWMYQRYIASDSYYSHGFIVPLVSLYLIWKKREQLRSCAPELSWWGLVIIVVSILIHITGTVLYIFSLSGISLFTLIIGMCLFLQGWPFTKIILFPLFFLGFMFPLPMAVLDAISFPMKLLVARAGVWIVSLMGIPIFREGVHISLASGQLTVDNPCSGLRSLIAYVALASLYAYWSEVTRAGKLAVLALTIPIALLCNTIRVVILVLLSNSVGIAAAYPESFWHDASGAFAAILGLIFFMCVVRLVK